MPTAAASPDVEIDRPLTTLSTRCAQRQPAQDPPRAIPRAHLLKDSVAITRTRGRRATPSAAWQTEPFLRCRGQYSRDPALSSPKQSKQPHHPLNRSMTRHPATCETG